MRIGHSIMTASLIGICIGVGSMAPQASAQTATDEDVQYASYVLLCEGRYKSKGTAEEIAFWQELRDDLTVEELRGGQGALGSVAGALSQINDSIIVQRCEEFRAVFENPDEFVDEASPELQAARQRVQGLIPVLLSELEKSGFHSSYLNDILGVGASISNVIEGDLERSKWIELYFNKVIFGLREQTKTLAVSSPDLRVWALGCAKTFSSDFAGQTETAIQSREFEAATDTALKAVLFDRLPIFARKMSSDKLESATPACGAANAANVQNYVEAPAISARIMAGDATRKGAVK